MSNYQIPSKVMLNPEISNGAKLLCSVLIQSVSDYDGGSYCCVTTNDLSHILGRQPSKVKRYFKELQSFNYISFDSTNKAFYITEAISCSISKSQT